MAVEVITREDLQHFRIQLLNDFRELLEEQQKPVTTETQQGLKTKQVRQLLGCSYNKLQSLRIAGKLRSKKIGGTVYYRKDDVRKLLEG